MIQDQSPYAPLPGTTPTPRGLFVHLWGTLLQTPEQQKSLSLPKVEFTPGSLNALFRATQANWNIYLLGNQPSVALGHVTEEEWNGFHSQLLDHLKSRGVVITRTYLCIDDPVHGVPGRQKDSVYQLPNTGAFYHAAHTDSLELRRSWVVGDTTDILVAGWRAGLRMVGLRSGRGLSDAAYDVTPEFTSDGLRDAVMDLLGLEGALHP